MSHFLSLILPFAGRSCFYPCGSGVVCTLLSSSVFENEKVAPHLSHVLPRYCCVSIESTSILFLHSGLGHSRKSIFIAHPLNAYSLPTLIVGEAKAKAIEISKETVAKRQAPQQLLRSY